MWYHWIFQGFPYSSKFILFKSFSIVPPAKILNLGQNQNKWTICWKGTSEVLPAQPSCLAAVVIAPGQLQPTYLSCISTQGAWLLDLVRLIHLLFPKAIFSAAALTPLYEVVTAVAPKERGQDFLENNSKLFCCNLVWKGGCTSDILLI